MYAFNNIISKLSEVNLFGLGVQKVLLELLFPSPAACLSASVAPKQCRLISHIIIIIIIIIFII